jgi:hypothetical protein
MERHSMGFVEFTDKEANLSSHYTFEGLAFWRNDIYGDSPGAQGCGNFQADKAGAYNGYPFRGRRFGDDRLAVGEGAKIVNLRLRSTFDRQVDRIGAGCE